jgi:hypothetical protein
MKIRRR